jgi:DNA adenine methylase
MPKPFIKWVGGKRGLVHELKARMPSRYGVYFEPFLGGGALFFSALPKRAVLSDMNLRLVRTYRAVRDDVEGVISNLQSMPIDKEFFMSLRTKPIDQGTNVDVAAWMIYMTRNAFNGLYRVNRKGDFNVPFGDGKAKEVCDVGNLRSCSQALQNVEIVYSDFDDVLTAADLGDFVYLDPPYVPTSTSSQFTSYTKDGMTQNDQMRLRSTCSKLKQRGVYVLQSNSDTWVTRKLYESTEFMLTEVAAKRGMNRCSKYPELLIQ